MIPHAARYGTIFRSTAEGTTRDLTLMFIGSAEVSAHVYAFLLACDPDTAREKSHWRMNRVNRIDVSDLWRFEVVE